MSPKPDPGGISLICSKCMKRLGQAWAPDLDHDHWRYRVHVEPTRRMLLTTKDPAARVQVWCRGCQRHGDIVPQNLAGQITEGKKSAVVRVAWHSA